MNGNQSNLAMDENVTLQFDEEIFDVGADFNTATYTFTAPITGKYFFSAEIAMNASGQNDNYEAIGKLITSNRNYITKIPQSAGENNTVNFSQICDMDANDTAYVQLKLEETGGSDELDVNAGSSSALTTRFTGYLLG
jgi:hypothetical protein